MKLAIYLLMVLGTSPLLAQTNSQSVDENEITALEQQMVQMDIRDHYSQRFIREHVDRNVVVVSPMGFLRSDHLLKPSRGNWWYSSPPMREKLTGLVMTFYGGTAVVHAEVCKEGKDISDPNKNWKDHGFLLHTWVKEKGSWRLVSIATGSFVEAPQITR